MASRQNGPSTIRFIPRSSSSLPGRCPDSVRTRVGESFCRDSIYEGLNTKGNSPQPAKGRLALMNRLPRFFEAVTSQLMPASGLTA